MVIVSFFTMLLFLIHNQHLTGYIKNELDGENLPYTLREIQRECFMVLAMMTGIAFFAGIFLGIQLQF